MLVDSVQRRVVVQVVFGLQGLLVDSVSLLLFVQRRVVVAQELVVQVLVAQELVVLVRCDKRWLCYRHQMQFGWLNPSRYSAGAYPKTKVCYPAAVAGLLFVPAAVVVGS
ncbi:MAG: hypothetical protein EBT92_19490 [Planctomycetes bacterium]|nr:hypothetical protein [Planctomycetota bacterium]